MIDEETVQKAIHLLLEAAPGSEIIVFGSHARGDATASSDLDLLVIEPQVTARRAEMARLADVLRPLRIPVDVLVVSRQNFDEWSNTPGTVLYEVASEGK